MRQGGSKEKGNSFERLVCTTLSLWTSAGLRADLFNRNVLSGGRFTVQAQQGKEVNMPGDIIAGHPLAFEFLSLFSIEAKHHKSIDLDKYLLDTAGSTFLSKVFALARAQALAVGLVPMVIAKQNRYPAIVLVDYHVGMAARDVTTRGAFKFHILHNNSVVMMLLSHLTMHVPPKLFLDALRRRMLTH